MFVEDVDDVIHQVLDVELDSAGIHVDELELACCFVLLPHIDVGVDKNVWDRSL